MASIKDGRKRLENPETVNSIIKVSVLGPNRKRLKLLFALGVVSVVGRGKKKKKFL